jgi:hypothetical protein
LLKHVILGNFSDRGVAKHAQPANSKSWIPVQQQVVKRVRLGCIPPMPLPCARIAKKASFKNWRNPSNTLVNFVSLAPLSKTKRNPAPFAWVGNIKKAAL